MGKYKPDGHEQPRIAAVAERQAHVWELQREQAERTIHRHYAHSAAGQKVAYLTIAREAGTGASRIAQLVGQELGWEVFDNNLLDHIACRFRLDPEILKLVDETPHNWVFDVLGTWMDKQLVSHDKFIRHLKQVITSLARRENLVFVGRGAQFILPRDRTLAVRLVAQQKYRVSRLMEDLRLTAQEAQRLTAEVDLGARDLAARFFHRDITDPHLYDLVLNVQRLGDQRAARLIAAAVAERAK